MSPTLNRIVPYAATLVMALASVCPSFAHAGGGHAGAGHGCAGHGMGTCGHHGGGAAFHACGGSYDDGAYRERGTVVDRELHDRAVKTQHAKEEFAKANTCPLTGAIGPSCPGYVIECIAPDPANPSHCFDSSNLQWRAVPSQGAGSNSSTMNGLTPSDPVMRSQSGP